MLQLKPQPEREAACISIWHRLVTTMVENVCNPQTTYEAENEGGVQQISVDYRSYNKKFFVYGLIYHYMQSYNY